MTPSERADLSAEFLDRHLDGWREHVDPEYVNMSNIGDCVLAQIGMNMFGMPPYSGAFSQMLDRLTLLTTDADREWWGEAWGDPQENDEWRRILGAA